VARPSLTSSFLSVVCVLSARNSAPSRRVPFSRRQEIRIPSPWHLRDHYNRITHLEDFPEIAILIGVYIAYFGEFEVSIWQTYAIVMGVEEVDAMQSLGKRRFSEQLCHVENLFNEKSNDMNGNSLVGEILSLTKAINTFRNKIAHSMYVTDDTKSKVYLRPFVTDPGRVYKQPNTANEANYFELSVGMIRAKTEEITLALQKNNTLVEVFKPHRAY
jgi:hypothetical protein